MTVLFLPIICLWIFYWLFKTKFLNFRSLVVSFVLSLGLSSFFLIPAFLEKELIQTESLTRFELDFRANFVSIEQLFFDTSWGYGTSIPGPDGKMSFQIGLIHWIIVLLSSIYLCYSFFLRKKLNILAIGALFLFLFSIFMMHNKSSFVWESISILKYFQFPWRFLSLSILTSSILAGFFVHILKNERNQKYISLLLISIVIILNFNYFKPKEYYKITTADKLTGQLWEEQRKGAILDYLPRTALEPREKAPNSPLVTSGKAIISDFEKRSNKWKFNIKVIEDAGIEIPVYYFPNWEVKVDKRKYPFSYDNYLGRIAINLKQGEYKVEGNFRNTTVRDVANLITILSFVGFLMYIKWKK